MHFRFSTLKASCESLPAALNETSLLGLSSAQSADVGTLRQCDDELLPCCDDNAENAQIRNTAKGS